MNDVTQILTAIEQGDGDAAEQLLPLVYKELQKLAAARMAREPADHTLQATALVHEAYIRLVGTPPDQAWQGRGTFSPLRPKRCVGYWSNRLEPKRAKNGAETGNELSCKTSSIATQILRAFCWILTTG